MPCRWRWRCGIPSMPKESSGGEIVYLPVSWVGGLDTSDYVVIYDYEVEALKLVHVDGLTTEEAATRLGVSKATFWRVLESCRSKLAEALSSGKPFKLVSESLRKEEGGKE